MKKITVKFSGISPGLSLGDYVAPCKADYDRAIELGYGDILTVEGFTIRETRDLLWGNPDGEAHPFEGLKARYPK